MKIRTLDDYYTWTCDWCDSDNRTLWVHVAKGDFICGACHRTSNASASTVPTKPLLQIMNGLC